MDRQKQLKKNLINYGAAGLIVAGAIINPAITGAALIGGSLLALAGNKKPLIEKILQQTFEICRLGTVNPQNKVTWPKLLHKHNENESGSTVKMIYSIPLGKSIKDFWQHQLEIQTALDAEVEMWEQNGNLHIRIMGRKMESSVPYEFDSAPYLKKGMVIPIPIGYSRSGLEVVDLDTLPHLLGGGTTGSGKSVALQGITWALTHYGWIRLYIIDMKRVEFGAYRNHAELATTLPQVLTMVAAIRDEMFRRLDMFQSAGVNHISLWRGEEDLPRIVLIIDEFAELMPENKVDSEEELAAKKICRSYLRSIAAMGRAPGIRVILFTQRPEADVVPGILKQSFDATLAFRVRNDVNAKILDTPMAEYIPREIKGRAIWNWQVEREVQVMKAIPKKLERMLPDPPVTKPGDPMIAALKNQESKDRKDGRLSVVQSNRT